MYAGSLSNERYKKEIWFHNFSEYSGSESKNVAYSC